LSRSGAGANLGVAGFERWSGNPTENPVLELDAVLNEQGSIVVSIPIDVSRSSRLTSGLKM